MPKGSLKREIRFHQVTIKFLVREGDYGNSDSFKEFASYLWRSVGGNDMNCPGHEEIQVFVDGTEYGAEGQKVSHA